MKEFFSSTRFKILAAIAVVLGAFMLRAAWTGGFGTLSSSLLGAVITPFQKVSSSISFNVSEFFSTFTSAKSIKAENERQKEEIRELNKKLVDYDKIKHQNDIYKDFLELKERAADLEIEPASVMGRDTSDRFYSFTIDKGSLDGIEPRDSVMTKDGFVGIVFEVGLTYAKVSTILDPANNIGVYDTRTRDTALITGTVELSEKGQCKMYLLPRESGAAVGDLIVTSGISGLYPKEQVIGKITDVKSESHGNSLYAIIEPSSDIKNIKDVLVVKSFAGQGSSAEQGGGKTP
ncbi:MAG: rod shape-determining protein MreC [Hydrogenoanaerobacterium sp.]